MEVIRKLTMDLSRESLPITVAAVRGDSALWLEFDLRSNGAPWTIPIGVEALVRYCLPAGTGGEYDTLSDGTRAYTIIGNLLRVAIAPAVCSQAGDVAVQVALILGGKQISTVPLTLAVARTVSGSGTPENYTNLAQWLKFNTGNTEVSIGELEARVIAMEQALAAHESITHLTEADVKRLIDDDAWEIPTYSGETEDA